MYMKLRALSMVLVLSAGAALAVAGDLENAVQSIKEAAAKGDVAAVKKLAATIRPMTKAIAAEAAPQGAEEKKAWAERVANAKSAQADADSAVVGAAILAEGAAVVDLISTLEKESPKSKALNLAYGPYLAALKKTGADAKIPLIVDKALVNFPENDDLLMYLTETTIGKRLTDRALGYANRLTAAVNKNGKPEGMAAEEWEAKRDSELSYGYFIAGYISAEKGQYAAADKNLRAALPLIQDKPEYLGGALYYLGMANFRLGEAAQNKARMQEGAKFNEQSMAIPGPYQDRAKQHAALMKSAQ
jgi:hypothetical protein